MATGSGPDYGIDAPGVIRALAISGAVCLLIATASMTGLLPPDVRFSIGSISVVLPLGSFVFPMAGLWSGAAWIYLGSRYGKIRAREALLDRITWRGDERVLDVGCGRGLLLVGAARRLTTGSATGIDIWQSRDLSDNRDDAPLENAQAEGVRARVSVETADMRRLPFADGAFDVVVSRAAIHNLATAADRAAAIREIARVLAPGGRAIIDDIRCLSDYVREFRTHGCPDTALVGSPLAALAGALVTWGSLRPNVLRATKRSRGSAPQRLGDASSVNTSNGFK